MRRPSCRPAGVLLVVACSGLFLHAAADICPPENDILPCRCRIRAQEMQIWCSHSELESVRRALEAAMTHVQRRSAAIDEVVLEQNKMAALPARALGVLQVRRLLLRHNGLQSVSRNAFAGLEGGLRELVLWEPALEELPFDTLDYLRGLEALSLQGASGLRRLPRLSALPRLKYVRVDGCGLLRLEADALRQLPAVRFFQLTGSQVSRLDAGALSGMGASLSAANLSHNLISHVHPDALQGLPQLQELDLSGNRLRDAAALGLALRPLAPALRLLQASGNPLEVLPEGGLQDMRALATLSLRSCALRDVRPGAFAKLPALRRLDLAGNLLQRLPADAFVGVPQLEDLLLQGNHLDAASGPELGALLAVLPQLRALDLSGNRLQELPAAAMGRGHHLLERLSLQDNGLRWIEPKALLGFPALTELRLRNNSLSSLEPSGATTWWHLPALKGLDLAHNQLTRLDDGLLSELPALRHVDLSGNQLVQLASGAFRGCPLLEHVNASGNALAAVPVDAFRGLQQLYELDLSRNRLAHLPDTLFRDLRSLELLSLARNRLQALPPLSSFPADAALQTLDASGNVLAALPVGALSSLRALRTLLLQDNLLGALARGSLRGLARLETLQLGANRLAALEDGALADAPRLQALDMQHNRLQAVGHDTFAALPDLRTLNLQHNRIASVAAGAFRDNAQLQELSLSHNELSELPAALLDLSSLQVLHASSNQLQSLGQTPLRRMQQLTQLFLDGNRLAAGALREGLFHDMSSLQILDLHGNGLQELGPRSFQALHNLRFLRLSDNRLRRVRAAALRDLPALQGLELQANALQAVSESAFQGMGSLRYLNLSHNQLDSLSRAGLQALPSLEMLDLSHNRILQTEPAPLRHMHWLVHLKMDNNHLCRIHPDTFGHMGRLRMLSLRNNQLARIYEDTFYRLKDNVELIDVSGNPLQCDCDLAWLRQWLQDNVVQEDVEARCFEPPELLGLPLRELRPARMTCSFHDRSAKDTCSPASLQAAASSISTDALATNTRGRAPRPGLRRPSAPDGTAPGASSQVLSAWMHVHNSSDGTGLGPQHSDYFDDEYVEYQYDDSSSPTSSANASSPDQQKPPSLSSDVIVIDPEQGLALDISNGAGSSSKAGAAKQAGLSPDVVPGDTPTIYAATSSKPASGAKSNSSSSKVGSPTGFSLFGIPLPSLDLGLTLGLAPTLSLVSKGLQGAVSAAATSAGVLGAADKVQPQEDALHQRHPHRGHHPLLNDAQPAGSGVPAYTAPDHPYIPLAPPPPSPPRFHASGFVPMDPFTPVDDLVLVPTTHRPDEHASSASDVLDYFEDYPSQVSSSSSSAGPSPSPTLLPSSSVSPSPGDADTDAFSLSELWGMLTGDKASSSSSSPSTTLAAITPPTPPTFTTTLRAGLGFHHGDSLPRRPPGRPTITKVEVGGSPSSSSPPPLTTQEPTPSTDAASSLPRVFQQQPPPSPPDSHPPDSLDWYYNNYHNDNQDPYVGPNPFDPSSSSTLPTPSSLLLLPTVLALLSFCCC